MNQFKQFWLNKHHLESEIEDEVDGANHYREMANNAKNKIEADIFSGMAMDEERHAQQLNDLETLGETDKGTQKAILGYVEKPGESIHSEKWDRCVEEVGKDPSVNAYAVCTAQLGVESFKSLSSMKKSQLDQVIEELDKMGIGEAGPIPNSLLARQDLDGTTTRKSLTIPACEVKEGCYLKEGRVVAIHKTDVGARIDYTFTCKSEDGKITIVKAGNKDILITKGQVEQTGKELVKIDEEAYEIDSSEERDALVDKIKSTQLKRQRAIISTRKSSFKELWKRI